MSFTHFDAAGRAVMVDVTKKAVTHRRATARCSVTGLSGLSAFDRVALGHEVLPTSRVAAILAAKKTPSVIPLCHPLPLRATTVEFEIGEDSVTIVVTTETESETGVEMEALTGAAFGALSLYEALAPYGDAAMVTSLELMEKRGGRSGTWLRTRSGSDHGEPIA